MAKIQKYGSGWLPQELLEVEVLTAAHAAELSKQGGVAVEFGGAVYAGGSPTSDGAFPAWPADWGLWA